MSAYSVERTAPTVYLNDSGQAVNGFIVYVRLEAYDELHEVRVANLTPKTVEQAVNKLVASRDALANLGKPTNGK